MEFQPYHSILKHFPAHGFGFGKHLPSVKHYFGLWDEFWS
jgi:hypothetical protein